MTVNLGNTVTRHCEFISCQLLGKAQGSSLSKMYILEAINSKDVTLYQYLKLKPR